MCTVCGHLPPPGPSVVQGLKQIFFFSYNAPLILAVPGAQLATAWSTRGTCTVCGHPTMSNYSLCDTINSRSRSSSLPAITLQTLLSLEAGTNKFFFFPGSYHTSCAQGTASHCVEHRELFVATPL